MRRHTPFILSLFVLSGCDRIDSLLWQPKTLPEEWCQAMPCVDIFSTGLVLNQPFSTFFVYLLGCMWLWAGWRYMKHKNTMDLVLLGSWILLVVTNLFYFAYLLLGFTQKLWEKGIWFSENDVLHILMIIWVLYSGIIVAKTVEDAHDTTANPEYENV